MTEQCVHCGRKKVEHYGFSNYCWMDDSSKCVFTPGEIVPTGTLAATRALCNAVVRARLANNDTEITDALADMDKAETAVRVLLAKLKEVERG